MTEPLYLDRRAFIGGGAALAALAIAGALGVRRRRAAPLAG